MRCIKTLIKEFETSLISFTFTDSFACFLRRDGHISSRKVFTLYEIDEFVKKYGCNSEVFGRKTYIELQYWGEISRVGGNDSR